MKAIAFHNWGRYGDLHVSRSFVKRLVEHAGVPAHYYHAKEAAILRDVPVEHHHRSPAEAEKFVGQTSQIEAGCLSINTWYGAGERRFASAAGNDVITFDTLYRLFDDAARRHLDTSLAQLGEPVDFLPEIDFTAYPVTVTSDFLNPEPKRKRVFFDTVDCLSGQASNFPLPPVVRNVALRRPDLTFYYTWPGTTPGAAMPPNALWTRDVHGVKDRCDLNENAYLSTFCDVIIGRNSSSFTFALMRENLVQRPAHFIELSTLPFPLLVGPFLASRIPATYSVVQSAAATRNAAIEVILEDLARL